MQDISKERIEEFRKFVSSAFMADNRKNRRHPEKNYDSRYKRPKKGQKIYR